MLEADNSSDIKALLILLLLKGGTQPEEIQTAMRMAATSRLIADSQRAALPPRDDRPEPAAGCSCGGATIRPSTPKQVIRNDYLAPIKGHAA